MKKPPIRALLKRRRKPGPINPHEHELLHSIKDTLEKSVAKLHRQGVKIMSSQAQATQDLKDVKAQLVKIGAETQTLIDKINALPVPPDTTPEFDAALADVKAQAKVVDDMVPDPA